MSVPAPLTVSEAKFLFMRVYNHKFVFRIDFSEDGCWIWTGAKSGEYGTFCFGHGQYPAHRLAYAALHGPIPPRTQIDHKDHCNKLCVRPDHLRLATGYQNQQNRKGAPSTSSTGVRGVYRYGRRYQTAVQTRGKRYSAGTFDTIEEAERAVIKLRAQLFGEFAGGSR